MILIHIKLPPASISEIKHRWLMLSIVGYYHICLVLLHPLQCQIQLQQVSTNLKPASLCPTDRRIGWLGEKSDVKSVSGRTPFEGKIIIVGDQWQTDISALFRISG